MRITGTVGQMDTGHRPGIQPVAVEAKIRPITDSQAQDRAVEVLGCFKLFADNKVMFELRCGHAPHAGLCYCWRQFT